MYFKKMLHVAHIHGNKYICKNMTIIKLLKKEFI